MNVTNTNHGNSTEFDFQSWRERFLREILYIVAIIGLFILVPRTKSALENQSTKIQNGVKQVFKSRDAVAGVLMILFFCAAHEVVNLVFGVWMEDTYGLSINELGLASTAIGLAELISVALISWLITRVGSKSSVGIGLIASALTAISIPILGSFSVWGAEIGLFLFNLAFQMPFIAYAPLLSEVLPTAKASLLGTTFAAVGIGRMFGALIAPYIFAKGFLYNTIFSMLLFMISLFCLSKVKTQKKNEFKLNVQQ